MVQLDVMRKSHPSPGHVPGSSWPEINRRVELLAPGGDLDSIKAAIVAGADAIYCGLDKFNARHRAANITFENLGGVLALAHRHDCRVFLTLNIMMVESDIPVLVGMLNRLVNTSIDGVIVQDLGLFYLLSKYFERLKIHASTQLTTHNEGQLKFLRKLTATRANLSRELNISEIRPLVQAGHEQHLSMEVFVHGSYCLCFSGICYLSSVDGRNSGNRGRCSQPCRDRHVSTAEGRQYPLNLKDNAAYHDLQTLAEAGVDAMKIEGRMKAFHYVYTVTNTYSRRLQELHLRSSPEDHGGDLYRVFNRDFSNGFLVGDVGKEMFSDHPRNRSATRLRLGSRTTGDEHEEDARAAAYDQIADFKAEVRGKIEQVELAARPVTVHVSGRAGSPLKVSVHTPDDSLVVSSASRLALQRTDSTVPPLSAEMFRHKLKTVDQTEYHIDHLDLQDLQPGLFVPLREITLIKKRILYFLHGSREPLEAIAVPPFAHHGDLKTIPRLSVLIASVADLGLCQETGAEICFQLPGASASRCLELVPLFQRNRRLLPWFPAVLIGEDFAAAVSFLKQVRPRRIVTNNTGIAYEAWREGIPWIAGPQLNIANSPCLVSLKENFECRGAFVSNELSMYQIKRICPPADFELHYSIYHPITLLTSRQCLFQQVTGCEKQSMDDHCLAGCERSSSIARLDGAKILVKKTTGNYCSLYHQVCFLNMEICTDLPLLFSSFSIDLRGIETETRMALQKSSLVRLFEGHLQGDAESSEELKRSIRPTTRATYNVGI